jgi:hypothetical protein
MVYSRIKKLIRGTHKLREKYLSLLSFLKLRKVGQQEF